MTTQDCLKSLVLSALFIFLAAIYSSEGLAACCPAYTDQSTCESAESCRWIEEDDGYCACGINNHQELIIAMDGSGSIGKSGWATEKNLVADIVECMTTVQTRVGIILYSSKASSVWDFSKSQNRKELVNLVRGLNYPRGWSKLDLAINQAIDDFRNFGSADRRRLLIILTDGNPDTEVCSLKGKLGENGIAVGIVFLNQISIEKSKIGCIIEDPVSQFIILDDYSATDDWRCVLYTLICSDAPPMPVTEPDSTDPGSGDSDTGSGDSDIGSGDSDTGSGDSDTGSEDSDSKPDLPAPGTLKIVK